MVDSSVWKGYEQWNISFADETTPLQRNRVYKALKAKGFHTYEIPGVCIPQAAHVKWDGAKTWMDALDVLEKYREYMGEYITYVFKDGNGKRRWESVRDWNVLRDIIRTEGR